jgi:sec-independent protein translocase protein TatB
MLGLGWQEIALIAVLAIVVVGPERLPELLRFLGRQYGKVRRASDDLRRAFMLEADRADAEKRAVELRKRREQALARAEEVRRRALEAKGGQPDLSDLDGGGVGSIARAEGAAAPVVAEPAAAGGAPAAPALAAAPGEEA